MTATQTAQTHKPCDKSTLFDLSDSKPLTTKAVKQPISRDKLPQGVAYASKGGKFKASIRSAGRLVHLGTYPDCRSAQIALNGANKIIKGVFLHKLPASDPVVSSDSDVTLLESYRDDVVHLKGRLEAKDDEISELKTLLRRMGKSATEAGKLIK